MTKTGQTVTLRVAKQGAVYHGLADLLSQPSPIMQRSAAVAPSPTRRSAGLGPNKMMPRPKSEDVSRFNESPAPPGSAGPRMNNFPGQQGMYGAGSTPALTGACVANKGVELNWNKIHEDVKCLMVMLS